MARIFISYRRVDSRPVTNRIYDRLVAAFGKNTIFKDVDDIPPGRDFRGILREATADCDIMLVVIGPNWLDATDAQGKRRLDDPNDFVRLEVETGLQRDGVLVIPLLIEGAGMPPVAALPDTLRELAYNNAFTIHDDPLFHQNMDTLIRQLKGQKRRRFNVDWRWWVAAILILMIATMVTILPQIAGTQQSSTSAPSPTTAIAQEISPRPEGEGQRATSTFSGFQQLQTTEAEPTQTTLALAATEDQSLKVNATTTAQGFAAIETATYATRIPQPSVSVLQPTNTSTAFYITTEVTSGSFASTNSPTSTQEPATTSSSEIETSFIEPAISRIFPELNSQHVIRTRGNSISLDHLEITSATVDLVTPTMLIEFSNEISVTRVTSSRPNYLTTSYNGMAYGQIVYSHDETKLAVVTGDIIELWSTANKTLLFVLSEHNSFVNDIVFNDADTLLASASSDGSIILWEIATGVPLRRIFLTTAFTAIKSVRLSDSGDILAVTIENFVIVLTVATEFNGLCRTSTMNHNATLRSLPNTSSSPRGTLYGGQSTLIIAKTIGTDNFTWYRILGKDYWIRADVAPVIGDCASVLPQ